MTRTILAAALLLGAAQIPAPALAQAAGSCPGIAIVETSTGTQRIPRMGPASDQLTQSATFRNTGATELRFTVMLAHRAFQQNFVAGQSYTVGPNGQTTIMLGNVLRPGLTLNDVRATTRVTCQ